jgi:serine/threonine-protein kinase
MTQTRGTPLGSLIIEEKVSTSAAGELYLGRQPALDRWVSVRKLPADQLTDAGAVDRFLRSARLGARVIHPNLLQVFDCFALRGEYYTILEQVEGTDLAELCAAPLRVPRRVALSIGLEIARGLAALHARRIAHCALTPERVRIGRWGDVKLLDLGHARELDDEAPPAPSDVGPYTAPEVAAGTAGDPRADLYSLGAILHELIEGKLPSSRGSASRGLDPRLTLLLRRCLAPDAARRPTARSAIRRLRSLLRGGASEECRAEIAAWLWESRMARESREAAPGAERPAPAPRAGSRPRLPRLPALPQLPALPRIAALLRIDAAPLLRGALLDRLAALAERVDRRALARARIPAAIGAGIAAGVLLFTLSGEEAAPPSAAATPPVSAAGAGAPPALISFVIHPWAEVSIEAGPTFLTPRAAPVELAPGRYEVALAHPRFGVVHRTIELAPGETKLVRHVYDQVHP